MELKKIGNRSIVMSQYKVISPITFWSLTMLYVCCLGCINSIVKIRALSALVSTQVLIVFIAVVREVLCISTWAEQSSLQKQWRQTKSFGTFIWSSLIHEHFPLVNYVDGIIMRTILLLVKTNLSHYFKNSFQTDKSTEIQHADCQQNYVII